jgi:WD40 repeat protein
MNFLHSLFGKKKITRTAQFTDLSVQACSFMPDGKAIAVGCKDGQVHLLDLEQGSSLKIIDVGLEFDVVFGKKTYREITEIAISRDGKRMAVRRESGRSVGVWDLHTGEKVFSKDLRTSNEQLAGFTQAIALSSEGGRVAIACSTGNYDVLSKHPVNYLYDVETGQETLFQGHQLSEAESPLDNRINDLDFSPDGRFLISAADDGRAIVWALNPPGGPQRLLKRESFFMARVCFSHSGKTFAAGGYSLQDWPSSDYAPSIEPSVVGNDEKFKALVVEHSIVDFLAFNRDDSKLLVLVRCQEKSKGPVFHRLWLWSEGAPAKCVEHNFGKVLAVSPDGSMIASMMDDNLVIWDLAQALE